MVPTIYEEPHDLLDGARGEPPSDAADRARRVAADPDQDVEARLEAFEDFVDSEVGDTNLSRARHLERETGLRQLFLKFEGGNPSGTQKDRIACAQVNDALRRGFDGITVATCGNYGAAVAEAAALAGLRGVVYVPEGYRTRRLPEMEARGVEVRRAGSTYEDAVEVSQAAAEREELYDANPGGANTPIQLRAYGEIAFEIYDELRDAPAVVAVPVSNGTTLAGIHRGFVSLYRRGKTSRIPRMVAGSSWGKNPIIQAFRRQLPACEELHPAKIRETAVNEPLVNWRSIDGDLALAAIRSSGGWAADTSDRVLLQTARRLRERESLNVLPAASAGLAVLLGRQAEEPFSGDRYVAVITGRKG